MTICAHCNHADRVQRMRVEMRDEGGTPTGRRHVTDFCHRCKGYATPNRVWLPQSIVGDPMQYPELGEPEDRQGRLL